jgi:hypothetical protein
VFCLELYGEFLAQYEQKKSSWGETHDAEMEAWKRRGEEIDRSTADLNAEIDTALDAAPLDVLQVRVELLELRAKQHEFHRELLESNYALADMIAKALWLQLRMTLIELYGSDEPARNREILLAVAKALLGLFPGLDKLLSIWEIFCALHVPEEQANAASDLLRNLDSYASALISWGILHQVCMMLLESNFMMELGEPTRDRELVKEAQQKFLEKFERFCKELEESSRLGRDST